MSVYELSVGIHSYSSGSVRMSAVLQLSDIARLTGLAVHTVKQWSIGRPYKIEATVRQSSERGIPKLFSEGDALKFAVAAQLTRDGFVSRVINAALVRFNAHAATLAIISGRSHWWDLTPFDAVGRAEVEKKISTYVLDMARLRSELDRKIATKMEG
jgi:hypothetical protein